MGRDSRSLIPEETRAAYLQAEYCVFAREDSVEFILRVGQASAPLAALMRSLQVTRAAYLTACNPGSQLRGAAENAAAQAALIAELAHAGYMHLYGEARDPSGHWPAEPSMLVPGIEKDAAAAAARRHGQNAFLHASNDGVPRLILLR